jgi:conjugative relaxase-like TrwC/TraI family protein
MRFTITPIGSTGGRTVGQVVDRIVSYLQTPSPEAARRSAATNGTAARYYADRATEAGRWLGRGTDALGLSGAVDPDEFASVLTGRDPRSGRRLITAQGSAGRRPSLGVGTHTRINKSGVALYSLADSAAALGLSQAEVRAMIIAGQCQALTVICKLTGGPQAHRCEPPGALLFPIIDEEDGAWVPESELRRCLDARARGTTAAEVRASGHPEDLLGVNEAARFAGVTARYLRGVCRHWEEHQAEIEASVAAGQRPRRAHLVAHRGPEGRWRIRRGDLTDFMERRAAPAVRVGYDLTLTTEKSLGVLALLGDEPTRQATLAAIQAGNDAGLAHLEQHAATARAKGKPIETRGLTIASFRHLTSRSLDPFPHHHNIIANTVVDPKGTPRALDARLLYAQARAASALATAEMRHRLSSTIGVRWRPARHGGWEVDGIGDTIVREFSRRRADIDDAVAELEAAIGRTSTLDELESAVLRTRPPKQAADPEDLSADWWQRAIAHGLTPDDLSSCLSPKQTTPPLDRGPLFALLASPEHGVCANQSTFTRSDALAAMVDLPLPLADGRAQPPLVEAAELERLTDAFLASHYVVRLHPPEALPGTAHRQDIFSTTEILAAQQQIIRSYEDGLNTAAAHVPEHVLEATLTLTPNLTDEQRELIEGFCTSGHLIQCAIGRAGTGKTTAMRTAAEAWSSAGHRVIGAAVKSEAARNLAQGAAIPTETIAWYLSRKSDPEARLDCRTILIVDEASTLSDRDLDQLLQRAARAGTAVRLIGDPDQHGAVTAGGMFGHLCRRYDTDTPKLTHVLRVQHPADRAATHALLSDCPELALAHLESAGHLHTADNELDLYLRMLERWDEARRSGQEHPMIVQRHQTRLDLNRLARDLRLARGELGTEQLTTNDGRTFSAGDRVVARSTARHLHVPGTPAAFVRNGAMGTVVPVSSGTVNASDVLPVAFDDIGTIDLPRTFIGEHEAHGAVRVGVDHAYAITSYAAQGATFPESTSLIDDHTTRAETYVDITRGETANHLVISPGAGDPELHFLPNPPEQTARNRVSQRLHQSGTERPAIEYRTERESDAPHEPPRMHDGNDRNEASTQLRHQLQQHAAGQPELPDP